MVGTIIIGKLLMAAWSREDTDEDKRRQFNLYCDEYQRFATSDLRSFIDEARKFRVAITLSHQTLSQLDEGNRTAAAGAANMVVFRVTGEDGKELAKSFDTTPARVLVGQEPERSPVADAVGHLVKRGHCDPRVTRFAQGYLQKLEMFIDKKYDIYPRLEGFIYETYLTAGNIINGRSLLNDCLYRCMSTKSDRFSIAPLALYVLAAAQLDGTAAGMEPFVKKTPFIISSTHYLEGFDKEAERIGAPAFIEDRDCDGYLRNLRKTDKDAGMAVVDMVRELR